MRDARKIFDRRTLVVLLVLLVLAGLTQWLLNINETPSATSSNAHAPDYTMENFTITAMDMQSRPKHRLQATFMAHYPDNDSTEFTSPHITIFGADKAPWEIYGKRGWMSGGRELILLKGDVLIENAQAPPRDRLRLVTKNLRVLPDEQYAETAQPVTITGQTSVTYATGMRAYLKDGRLQLLSKVRGTYAPKAKPAQH